MSVPTLNLTYLVAKSLATSFQGAAIHVRQHGQLVLGLKVPSISGAPNGLFALEGRLDITDANDWRVIQDAYSQLPGGGVSGALAVINKWCAFTGLNWEEVRLVWTVASGTGAASSTYRSR